MYQISNAGLFFYLFFLNVKVSVSSCFFLGVFFYLAGLFICAASVAAYCFPDRKGLNTNGIYRFSRNPMYVAYFICFAGMALLTQSGLLFGILMIFRSPPIGSFSRRNDGVYRILERNTGNIWRKCVVTSESLRQKK